jgi:hypothetical protein
MRSIPGDGTEAEASLGVEEVRDGLQLRDVLVVVAAVLDQQREHAVVLGARVRLVARRQLAEDHAPRLDLLLSVLNLGDPISAATLRKREKNGLCILRRNVQLTKEICAAATLHKEQNAFASSSMFSLNNNSPRGFNCICNVDHVKELKIRNNHHWDAVLLV